MQEFSAGNKNINKRFLPAENSHMRMRNKIKTNRDKSSTLEIETFSAVLEFRVEAVFKEFGYICGKCFNHLLKKRDSERIMLGIEIL